LAGPGSSVREWFQRSAWADLLGEDVGLVEIHKLYRGHDRLLVSYSLGRFKGAPVLA